MFVNNLTYWWFDTQITVSNERSHKSIRIAWLGHMMRMDEKRTPKRIWCGFDHASSLICGNKIPTRCNRGFYCSSYCLLNMFRAPQCPSSGAQEYYTVVAACGISCCGFQVAGLVWSWGLCVQFAGCCSNKNYNKNLCCI